MRKILLNSLFTSPAVLGATLLLSSSAFAAQKTEVAGLPVLEVGTESKVNPSASVATTPLAEVKSLETAKPQVQVAAEFSPAKSVVVNEPVKVAQAAPEASTTTSSDSLSQLNRYSREGRSMAASNDQVTSVSQLSDVRPTDWAFQALQSLVERYGCIAGYPDRTYRGNRALTRYEFAAGLNACLNRVNELIAASTAGLVKKEDLATLQKLQEQFAAELATLRGRVDALEARTTTLEKQQFSTTTKLAGEAIFAITDQFGAAGAANNTVFQNRVRLALNTSFSGNDLLVSRISAGNALAFPQTAFAAGTAAGEGLQTFNFTPNTTNQAAIDWLAYYFPVGKNLRFYVPAFGGLHYDYAPTVSPALDAADGGTGPLSVFAQRNPIYLIGGGAGVGANFNLSNRLQISAGYLADNSIIGGGIAGTPTGANNPAAGGGLFNGSYSALGQLTFSPSDAFQIGLTYVNAYRQLSAVNPGIFDAGGGTPFAGTALANGSNLGGAAIVNAYGVSAAFKFSPGLVLNAFGTYINAANTAGTVRNDVWSYGLGLAFPDFGKKGNLLGLFAGVQPYVANPVAAARDLPVQLEGFYKYQLNDNISITPGVIWVLNPGQTTANPNLVIGTIRTTFTF